ncbi:MAG TPA: hypothetical protein VJ953_08925 [Saprospiraceae bacterium]|nr:hypothetical protein [Saprospiraceae bacterium]
MKTLYPKFVFQSIPLCLLLFSLLSSCQENENYYTDFFQEIVDARIDRDCEKGLTEVGENLKGCFIYKDLDHFFSHERSGKMDTLDFDNDGNYELIVDTYASLLEVSARGWIKIHPGEGIRIAKARHSYRICTGYRDEYPTLHPPSVHSKLCVNWIRRDSSKSDTILVQTVTKDYVQAFAEGENITSGIEWSNSTIVLRELPWFNPEFNSTTQRYMLFESTRNGKTYYGWLQFVLGGNYVIRGTIINGGMEIDKT